MRRLRGPSPLYRLLRHSLLALACPAAVLAQPCNQGLPTGNLTGILNTYYPGAVGTVAAGSTTIAVDTSAIRGASTTPDIVAGDMLLVIQMQDADFNQVNSVDYGDGAGGLSGAGSTALNNTGRYEYVEAEGAVSGAGVITIRGANIQPGPVYGLLNSYTTAPRDDQGGTRRGQRTFQVVRVARRASGTLTAGLAASPWNGRTGGILAVDVAGDLALGSVTVSVDGLGFRGGVGISQNGDNSLTDTDYMTLGSDAGHGRKAEGIACTPDPLSQVPGGSGNDGCPRGDRARGAPGNGGGGGTDGDPAGGNDENTGGGGGGNGGAGGLGGNSWNSNEPVGGRGGAAFPATPAQLVMGGGGGAGTSHNLGPGTGSPGGGMVFLRAGTVSGAGTLSADGADAAGCAQVGGGRAGAGGRVVVFNASGALTGLSVTAAGGRGGDADFGGGCNVANSPHGPGGGGGGGVVFASSALSAASSVVGGQSGRTAGNIAYGSTAGANGSITTTLAVTSIPGVQACTVATRASLAGLRVRRGLVEFATASQRDTLAFQLYATADPAGHRGNRPLHARPIPAPLPDTLDAVLYRVPVKEAAGPYVLVEEIETSGRRRALGPFAAGDASLREAFERLEARAAHEQTRTVRGARLLTGRPLVRAQRLPAGPTLLTPMLGARPPGVKVETRGTGTATVSLADLAAAGLPPGQPEALRVFHRGRLVPHRLLRTRGAGPTAISFEARPLSTDYTDRAPYVVWRGDTSPPAPLVPITRSGPPLAAGWQRVETNAMYGPFLDLESDPWVWDFLITGLPTLTKTFALPELLPGGDPVPVRVHFAGSSAHRHQVRVALNGVALGSARFTGRSHGVVEGSIPRALLHTTGNELAIDYDVEHATDPPSEVGVAFFDAIDLGALAAPAANAVAPIARIAPYDPGLPDLSGVDDLVLTHADFEAAALRLASWHESAGRRTVVVDVERAYDAFGSGAFEAEAVRGLLQRLRPRSLVVLFGDDTLDPRDYLGLGSVSYVPSLMAWDGQFGRIASENRFADQDGDGSPDLAIGRLPASTPEEAETLVDKILAGGPPIAPDSTQIVAVDDHGPTDVPFRDVAERIAAPLPFGAVTWADVAEGIGPARAALLGAWSQGPVVVNYFGHSGADTWADEHLLTPADAAALANIGPPPVVFTWTCQAQWYQYHLGPSVNEALLQAPQGGALATIGPTGISDPGRQALLAERVLAAVLEGVPLGESVRQAKADVLLQHAGMQGVVEGFTLLGDPALVVGGAPPAASRREQDP
jgi:hypothetical protein